MIAWMKKANNFQITTFQAQGVALFLLAFLPILAWRCLRKCCLLKKCVYFKKVLLIHFISSYSSFIKHFSFADLLQIEYNEQDALQKKPVIAPFVVQFKQLL